LNIKCEDRFWTDEQKQKVIKYYPKLGTKIPELLESGKTRYAIKNMAKKLNVKYSG
jgi:predicted N-acyltransferase